MNDLFDYYRDSANITGIEACFDYLVSFPGVDINAVNVHGHTALTFAMENGLTEMAGKLLKAGAQVNHPAEGGATALCWAIRNGDVRAVKLLLDHGAKTDFYVECLDSLLIDMPMASEIRALIV